MPSRRPLRGPPRGRHAGPSSRDPPFVPNRRLPAAAGAAAPLADYICDISATLPALRPRDAAGGPIPDCRALSTERGGREQQVTRNERAKGAIVVCLGSPPG